MTSLTAGFLTPLDSFWLLCVSCLVTAVVATVISFCSPQRVDQHQARRKYTWFSDEKAA